MAVEEIIISSEDNISLSLRRWMGSGDHSQRSEVLVLFVHQYAVMGGSGQLMEGMIDLRGAGRSTGRSSWTNQNELRDVQAVIDYVLNTTSKKIFLVGSSAGAPLSGACLDYSDRILGGLFVGYVWGFWASILSDGPIIVSKSAPNQNFLSLEREMNSPPCLNMSQESLS